MFFTMPCPGCGKPLKGRDDLLGRTARCPYCRASVTVQRPAPAVVPPVADEPEGPTAPIKITTKPPKTTGTIPGATTGGRRSTSSTKVSPPAVPETAFAAAPDTNVSGLRAFLIAIAATAVFYLLLWPISSIGGKQTYLGRLFIGTSSFAGGGWVPIAEVFLFTCAGGMLLQKWLKIRGQQRGLLYDVLPQELGDAITLDTIDQFVSHIRSLPKDAAGSFLITRCLRGLEHFRVRKSASDTATMLASQSDIDASNVDASYTMFHVFIWAIPILGFLGTVIGVSSAVAGFTGTLESSSDIGGLKDGLKSITSGLGTAFDTTLVALSMAMLLTFPVSSLQKNEGDILGQIDEYTNENFLRRLDDGRDGGAERGLGGSRSDVGRLIDQAMAPHRAQLEAWTQSLQSIGADVSAQVKRGWDEVTGTLVEEHARQASRIHEIDGLVTASSEGLLQTVANVNATHVEAGDTLRRAASSVETYTASLERSLAALAATLEKFGDEKVVVEIRERPWWSPFGSRPRR